MEFNQSRIISCHLGNGASIAAIFKGKSIDTSMGFTPVEGLIMGTRSGDLDLGVLTFIMDKEEINQQTANTLINKHSGMLGISGISSDLREIENEAWNKGNKRAQLALDMFNYRVLKYIGAYSAAMNGVDLILFTGGIGENAPEIRENICRNLEFLGVDFDPSLNDGQRGKDVVLTRPGSRIKVMAVTTNEELVIAEDTQRIVTSRNK